LLAFGGDVDAPHPISPVQIHAKMKRLNTNNIITIRIKPGLSRGFAITICISVTKPRYPETIHALQLY
jgi:hypothetical protein